MRTLLHTIPKQINPKSCRKTKEEKPPPDPMEAILQLSKTLTTENKKSYENKKIVDYIIITLSKNIL
jgi:hypothetical protein